MELLNFKDPQGVKNVILDSVQKENQVVYGQQSVNVQLPKKFRRKTKDFDILTKKPKKSAEKLVKQLNKVYGEDSFRVEPAIHGKTFKVKSREGKTVADYTSTTKKPKTKEVWGVKYANIDYQKKKLKKILKDESYKFRHDKDIETLKNIREGRIKKW